MLTVIEDLFADLSAANVPFCNWKGVDTAEDALNGGGDLDLFVPMSSSKAFQEVADRQGFRRVNSFQAQHDFIEHYYALDPFENKFAHLHIYYKIVTGEHASKNYMLPLDEYLLRNIDEHKLNNIAARNVFLVRHFLKVGSLYGLFQYSRELSRYSCEWKSFDHSQPYREVPELDLSDSELDRLRCVYQDACLLKQFLEAVRFKIRFKDFRRRGFFAHRIYIGLNLILRLTNRIWLRRKKVLSPGLVIAICGLDGSGKSSMVGAVGAKFSQHFCVKILHLGRPRPTTYSVIFRPLLRFHGLFRRNDGRDMQHVSSRPGKKFSLIHALRAVVLAHERKIAATRAHKYCKQGYLVFCDRYPGLGDGKMDSPRIPLDEGRGKAYQYCYRLERRLYRSISPASEVFHLTVPLEVALERNKNRNKIGKESDTELTERFARNSDAVFLAQYYRFIDARAPFDVVFKQLCKEIWFSKAWKDSA